VNIPYTERHITQVFVLLVYLVILSDIVQIESLKIIASFAHNGHQNNALQLIIIIMYNIIVMSMVSRVAFRNNNNTVIILCFVSKRTGQWPH